MTPCAQCGTDIGQIREAMHIELCAQCAKAGIEKCKAAFYDSLASLASGAAWLLDLLPNTAQSVKELTEA